jgi:hypothetical protein
VLLLRFAAVAARTRKTPATAALNGNDPRSPIGHDVMIAVLRHQVAVVRRQVTRPRYTPRDRLIVATLAKLLPRDRWPIFLDIPSTLFAGTASWSAGVHVLCECC